MSPKPWENAEGYADPTAYNAIKKVSAEGMRRWMPRSTLSSRSSSLSLRKAALSWRPALSSGTARQGGFLDDNHHNDLQALRAHPCH